jgi:predicted regulator of Ras-like GTPase activity (Roadblock/LC7/MglB family)
MADNGIGDYFISDIDDEMLEEDDELIAAPVVVPGEQAVSEPAQQAAPPQQPPAQPAPTPAPAVESPPVPAADPATAAAARPQATARPPSREERLASALDELMVESPDVQAAALVSMDGFTMASALPEGMQEDRVGAMSAAILGLGERAAAELGRGHLTQVFIEGDDGYVVLIAAGSKAVLTTLARTESKLGLVLYDMSQTAETISEILG